MLISLMAKGLKSFSYQWLCTERRFETEACGNSEMAVWTSAYLQNNEPPQHRYILNGISTYLLASVTVY